jgi:hypothetical protein
LLIIFIISQIAFFPSAIQKASHFLGKRFIIIKDGELHGIKKKKKKKKKNRCLVYLSARPEAYQTRFHFTPFISLLELNRTF